MANEGTFWVDKDQGLLVIKDENGVEDKFLIEEELEIEENKYLILIPEEMMEDDEAEAFVLKIVSDQEEEVLTVVDDEKEFEMVRENYLRLT